VDDCFFDDHPHAFGRLDPFAAALHWLGLRYILARDVVLVLGCAFGHPIRRVRRGRSSCCGRCRLSYFLLFVIWLCFLSLWFCAHIYSPFEFGCPPGAGARVLLGLPADDAPASTGASDLLLAALVAAAAFCASIAFLLACTRVAYRLAPVRTSFGGSPQRFFASPPLSPDRTYFF